MIKYIVGVVTLVLLLGSCSGSTIDGTPKPDMPPADMLGITEQIVYFNTGIQTGCGIAEDTHNAFYCPMDDTIYIGLPLKAEITYAQYVMVLAHEDGHSSNLYKGPDLTFYNEQFADCYAGYHLLDLYNDKLLNDKDIGEVRDWFYEQQPGDHGTPAQRWAAFEYGFKGGNCYEYTPH